MKVVYKVRRGDKLCHETEEYPTLEAATRGIQDRIADPFGPAVAGIVEISDRKGRLYDVEWACLVMPRMAQAA